MTEETVTVVRIKGEGAGVHSKVEMPKATYERMIKEAGTKGGDKSILDYKLLPKGNEAKVMKALEDKEIAEKKLNDELAEAVKEDEIQVSEEETLSGDEYFEIVKQIAMQKGMKKAEIKKLTWEDFKESYDKGLSTEKAFKAYQDIL